VFRSRPFIFICTALIVLPILASGQEANYDSLLQRIDTVENPVYKPVISFSLGVLNFRGDVRNSLITPAIGNYAGMLNVATFIDKKNRYYIANFNFLAGRMSANEYSHTDLARNLNFETQIYSFGVNIEYRFGHLIDKSRLIRPYISLGLENINFSSKGDLQDAGGLTYHYWSDGSIRDISEQAVPGPDPPVTLYRDYQYETDLRLLEDTQFGLGSYSQRSLAFPAEAGLHFMIGSRAFFSLGVSYHYTLTDFLDNVAYEGTSIQGARGNDSYVFSHLSLHFDLFSDPTTRIVDLLYADVDFDALFFDDEDADFVLDVSDRCPGTPYGVAVDSLGCPLDGDADGVPDYQDRELGSAPGAWVDDEGVTVTEETFYASIANRDPAMPRDEVALYLATIMEEYRIGTVQEIPEKFRVLDEDGDGYISFEELLIAVDLYFDFRLELNIDEVRELNDFFFSQ
jgi:hypothetical protein